MYRIYSWNVNGVRACTRKGLHDWLKRARGYVVAMQETRATNEQIAALPKFGRYRGHFVSAARPGYSGVGLLSRAPFTVETELGEERFDREGRLQIARVGDVTIVNAYFPNGSGKDRDHSRVPYKLAFYEAVFEKLQPALSRGEKILVVGDFNTAPEEIDLARPKQNRKTSGFLDVEREDLRRQIARGYTDTFRHLHPDKTGAYSWWSQRFGVRERNVGWRIDLMLVSPTLLPFVRAARIHTTVLGSDHCPISIDLDRAAFDT